MKRTFTPVFMLVLSLLFFLTSGCSQTPAASSPSPTSSQSLAPAPTPSPDSTTPPVSVRLAMLKGPTGIGAVKLMADNEAGTSRNHYEIEVAVQPTDLTGKLISGEVDIAALPTNLAANLYQKTQGEVQLLALNTLGVLYLLENGDTVHSLADLRGQTVYAAGQGANPEYLLNYLLRQSGLDPQQDLTIVWKSSDEVSALMATGDASLALLPVPAATAVLMQNQDVRAALDLNDVWTASGTSGSIYMGCVAARTSFLEDYPQVVEDFLTEYAASIDYVKTNVDQAAELAVRYEITPQAAIAKQAIPQANLVCITGIDMLSIQDYYEVLVQADPDSIGGSIPDGAFYYGAA